jgi:hypothetical protein
MAYYQMALESHVLWKGSLRGGRKIIKMVQLTYSHTKHLIAKKELKSGETSSVVSHIAVVVIVVIVIIIVIIVIIIIIIIIATAATAAATAAIIIVTDAAAVAAMCSSPSICWWPTYAGIVSYSPIGLIVIDLWLHLCAFFNCRLRGAVGIINCCFCASNNSSICVSVCIRT